MGQELFDVRWIRKPRKYYLATNSKGHKVVRGSAEKEYTHATIYKDLYASGYCGATFSSRLDLAQRYAKRWSNHEVVEIKEITSKEARQHKKEINQVAKDYQEKMAQRIANVYGVER